MPIKITPLPHQNGNALGTAVAVALSMLANRNDYKKMVQGRLDWF